MSEPLGDINTSQILYFKFTTVDSTGAPFALASGAISVYKDDDGTQSTAGITLTSPFDSVTGMHNVKIDTSADGSFYAAGHDYDVVITTGTVNSISVVGYVLAHFSIENRNQKVNATKIGGTTQTGRDIGASVLLSPGAGTGQLDFTAGVVKANTTLIEGSDATDQIASALLNFTNGIENGLTVKKCLQLCASLLVGLSTGFPGAGVKNFSSADLTTDSTGTFVQGTETRVEATTDATGNRSLIYVDFS